MELAFQKAGLCLLLPPNPKTPRHTCDFHETTGPPVPAARRLLLIAPSLRIEMGTSELLLLVLLTLTLYATWNLCL